MECLVEKLGKMILADEEVLCLPPQVHSIFDETYFDFPLCQNEIDSAMTAYMVMKICLINDIFFMTATTFLSDHIGCHGKPTRIGLPDHV